MSSNKRELPLGFKGLMGIAGCVIGLGVVYFGSGIDTASLKSEEAVEATPAPQPDRKRPVRSMNLALGDMVFFARDLGFAVTGAQDEVVSDRIATRIENQLQEIRGLYRQELHRNPALAGSLTLQFDIGPDGEAVQVRELSSRLNDAVFKHSVVAAAAKWSFTDLAAGGLQVRCTLLFVHEGMDITTLVQWEKSLADAVEAVATLPAANAPQTPPQPKPVTTTKASVTTTKAKEFHIKYTTGLRKEPSFSSASLASLAAGTKIQVLRPRGDWIEVRSLDGRSTGFVRREFVTTVEIASR